MKTETLLSFSLPVVETPVCAACGVMVPECLVPVGEGSKGMCWLCAHYVVDHNVDVEHAGTARCSCKKEQIYPRRVLEARELRAAAKPVFAPGPAPQRVLAPARVAVRNK